MLPVSHISFSDLQNAGVFEKILATYDQGDTCIFIHADRSPLLATLIWAAWQARIPYIPADTANPVARIQHIFDQVRPRLLFIDSETAFYKEKISLLKSKILDQTGTLLLLEIQQEDNHVHPADLASVLFTSGTTGIPKGVMVSRTNTQTFAQWMCTQFRVDAQARILSVSPLHFDLSVFDFFAPYFGGASLFFPEKSFVMNPQYLAEFIFQHKIDTVYATPTWYSLLLQFGKVKKYNFDFVKTLLVAGEAFKETLAWQLHETFPAATISNLYGPTETNVCTFYTLGFDAPLPQRGKVISIGKACPYNTVFIDRENILHVKGHTLMLGYWPKKQQLADYATGDIVEQNQKDGLLYFLSRADQMIKRNGYRIEPGEIETCLMACVGIGRAAITSHQYNGQPRLVAHIQPSAGQLPDLAHVREYCLSKLPSYMLPDEFVLHDELPLTSSGKTDYKKLNDHGK